MVQPPMRRHARTGRGLVWPLLHVLCLRWQQQRQYVRRRTEVEGRHAAEHVHEPALHVPRLLQALHDVGADDQDEAADEVDGGDADLCRVA